MSTFKKALSPLRREVLTFFYFFFCTWSAFGGNGNAADPLFSLAFFLVPVIWRMDTRRLARLPTKYALVMYAESHHDG